MLRGLVAIVALAGVCVSACSSSSKKDPDDPKTVPEGIGPEDAFFAIKQRFRNGTPEKILAIRMAKANVCDRKAVPNGTEWVDLIVAVPPGSDIPAAVYGVGLDGQADIVLQTAKSAECQSSQGLGASRGSITIQELSANHVKGSFVGSNADTKLDLSGTFLAKKCPDELNACL